MQHLTLTEIAPYLPYDLRMYNPDLAKLIEGKGQVYHPSKLRSLTADGLFWVGKEMDSRQLSTTNYRPVLLPISSLTKPMDDGSVPLDELKKLSCWDKKECLWIEIALATSTDEPWDYNDFPYGVALWLYERKFDVRNLIERGIAVDATTLNVNPYSTK